MSTRQRRPHPAFVLALRHRGERAELPRRPSIHLAICPGTRDIHQRAFMRGHRAGPVGRLDDTHRSGADRGSLTLLRGAGSVAASRAFCAERRWRDEGGGAIVWVKPFCITCCPSLVLPSESTRSWLVARDVVRVLPPRSREGAPRPSQAPTLAKRRPVSHEGMTGERLARRVRSNKRSATYPDQSVGDTARPRSRKIFERQTFRRLPSRRRVR
jgi:hypothetical protein